LGYVTPGSDDFGRPHLKWEGGQKSSHRGETKQLPGMNSYLVFQSLDMSVKFFRELHGIPVYIEANTGHKHFKTAFVAAELGKCMSPALRSKRPTTVTRSESLLWGDGVQAIN
jgi:hypothetical protein